MRYCSTGAHRRSHQRGLGQLGIGGTGILCGFSMKLEAIGALRGQGNGNSHELLVQDGQLTVGKDMAVELAERTHAVGCMFIQFFSCDRCFMSYMVFILLFK